MPPADSTPPPTSSRTVPLMPPLPGDNAPAAALPDPAIPTADSEAGAKPSPAPMPPSPYLPGASMPPPYPSTPYPSAPPTPPVYTPPSSYAPPPYPYAPMSYLPFVPNGRRRAGYIIAGIGSVLALLAFFAFPFITISASLAPSTFSYSQSLTASQIAGSSQSFSVGAALGLSAGTGSVLWVTALAALAALILCVAVPFSTAAIRNGPHHFAGWSLIAGGLVSTALTIIIGLMTLDQFNQTLRRITSGLGLNTAPIPIDFSISAGPGIGFYVLIASLLTMVAGGIVVVVRHDPLFRPSAPGVAPPTQPTAYP